MCEIMYGLESGLRLAQSCRSSMTLSLNICTKIMNQEGEKGIGKISKYDSERGRLLRIHE